MAIKSMLVRAAAPGDIAALATLIERYWKFESIANFSRPRVESLLAELVSSSDRGACWVAEVDGELCGYLVAVFVMSLEHGGMMAEIDEFFVADDLRSTGVGALLLTRCERDLAQRGLVRLQLQLGIGNAGARRFYERHGFAGREGYELLDKALAVA